MAARKRTRTGARKAASRPRTTKARARRPAARAARRPATRKTARPTRRPSPRPARKRRSPAGSRSTRAAQAAAPVLPVAPNAIGCIQQHIDFTSHAMEDMKHFYTEVLGFSNFVYDSRFNYLSVVTGGGARLGFMPPMPGPPEQWRPPREPALYFMVEDVEAAYRTLQSRGVMFQQEPTDMPWMHRVAVLKDPEGRLIMLAQALAR